MCVCVRVRVCMCHSSFTNTFYICFVGVFILHVLILHVYTEFVYTSPVASLNEKSGLRQ